MKREDHEAVKALEKAVSQVKHAKIKIRGIWVEAETSKIVLSEETLSLVDKAADELSEWLTGGYGLIRVLRRELS